MFRVRFGFLLILAAAGLLFVNDRGVTVDVTERPGETVYAFRTIAAVVTGVAGVLCLAAATIIGFARIGLVRWYGILAVLVGLLLCGGAYETATDYLIIDESGMTLPGRGFPFRPHETVRFDELAGVRALPNKGDLEFDRKNRTHFCIPRGDLVRKAEPAISRALKEHGVVVVGMD